MREADGKPACRDLKEEKANPKKSQRQWCCRYREQHVSGSYIKDIKKSQPATEWWQERKL